MKFYPLFKSENIYSNVKLSKRDFSNLFFDCYINFIYFLENSRYGDEKALDVLIKRK